MIRGAKVTHSSRALVIGLPGEQDQAHAPVRPQDAGSCHRLIHRIGTDGLAGIEGELARDRRASLEFSWLLF